jgi:hypothetical protein
MPNNMPCVPMAYPNPIRGDRVKFDLGCIPSGRVECRIYTLNSSLIRRMVWDGVHKSAGEFDWDVRDLGGHPLSNGIYVAHFTIRSGGKSTEHTTKILVLR